MTIPPLAIRTGRRALAEMFIELSLAFRASIALLNQPPGEIDANLTLAAVAVMLGHAEGKPMNASEIAARLKMPRTSVLRRLEALLVAGVIERTEGRYTLAAGRANHAPNRDRFELILSKAFAALVPILSKMDT